MKIFNDKIIKKLLILSMAFCSFSVVKFSTSIMALQDSNNSLKISTNKSVVNVGDEVTVSISPLRYKIDENGLLGINIKVIADKFQESGDIQSIELPRTYFKSKDGKKLPMYYLIRSTNYVNEGIEVHFPVDSPNSSQIVTKEELSIQHGEGKISMVNIMLRMLDENGDPLSNYDGYINEVYMEDSIKVTYKINDSGNSYNNSTYFYAYAEMGKQRTDLSSEVTHEGKLVLFSNTKMTFTDDNYYLSKNNINKGKIYLDNYGKYKNTRLGIKIISADIEVVSDNFKKSPTLDNVYESKIYTDDQKNKYYTILPGEKLALDYEYKLKNKNLQAGETINYKIIFYQFDYTDAIDEYEMELVVSEDYKIKYESIKYQDYLKEDNNIYMINDKVLINGFRDLPADNDFIGWEISKNKQFIEEGSTVSLKDIINGESEIVLNAVFADENIKPPIIDENHKDDKPKDRDDVNTSSVFNNYFYVFIIIISLSILRILKKRKYD